jgi:ATP-dependent DNA ligase
MPTNRPTTVRRVEWYLGPDEELKPEDLDRLEATGKYIVQPKIDGMWCMMEVRNPREGRPHFLKSRDARTPAIDGSEAGDLGAIDLGLPEGTILIGELEASSQWGTDQALARGYRRLHLFDLVKLVGPGIAPGASLHVDLRDHTTEQRYRTLTELHGKLCAAVELFESRFPLVPSYGDRFRARYDEWVAQGFEGLVAKTRDSLYRTSRLDGKLDAWKRVKRIVTEDYVLMGFGMTPGGKTSLPQRNGLWGLWKDGKLTKVMQTGCPMEYLIEENVGKLVCEFKGWQRFKSGALQHPQFVRVRKDKQPGECVFKPVKSAEAA